MKKLLHLSITISCFVFHFSIAQNTSKYIPKDLQSDELEVYENAEFYFEEKNYVRALSMYLFLAEKYPHEHYFKYMSGRCCIYIDYERKNAVGYLSEIENTNNDFVKKDILLYLAKAYHINNQFQKAKDYYYKYLEINNDNTIKLSAEEEKLVKLYVNQCANGEDIQNDTSALLIHNIGREINSSASEYVPLINSDGSIIIYTYRGERSIGGLMDFKLRSDPDGVYYEDIFISNNIGGHWLSPSGIADNINTKGHDASIALSADGQTLFIYKSTTKDNGDIYVSKLTANEWSSPVRLNKNINTNFWEGSCSISADELTLYFSSERPGGYGGKDIWVSKWENGDWGIPSNLGSVINTPYNDDAPFIHPDGLTLFFSSEGHTSIGGYDVLFSKFKDGEWSVPQNMGMPVNTAGDDRYYVLSADGEIGFFSSDREGGMGQHDIYIATPAVEGGPPALALLLGVVTMDDKPVGATISIKNVTTGVDGRQHRANSSTGKYLLALTPGNEYKIAIEVDGTNSNIQYLDIKGLDTYVKVEQAIPFYTEAYKKANGISDEQASISFQKSVEQEVKKKKEEELRIQDSIASASKPLLDTVADDSVGVVSKSTTTQLINNSSDTTAGNTTSDIITKTTNQSLVAEDKKTVEDSVQTPNSTTSNQEENNSVTTSATPCDNNSPNDFSYFVGKDLNNPIVYAKLMETAGGMCVEGLVFTVQIGAYRMPQNFKYLKLKVFGEPDVKKYPDGITRFTMREFKMLKDAEQFRQEVINKGTKDAWITAWYKGNRMLLTELIPLNFYNAGIN